MVVVFRGLDFTPVDHSGLPPTTPIVVVMHGLTGGMTPFVFAARQLRPLKARMNRM